MRTLKCVTVLKCVSVRVSMCVKMSKCTVVSMKAECVDGIVFECVKTSMCEWDTVCAGTHLPRSPGLRYTSTPAPPLRPHHTHITPSLSGPCQTQTSWVTPLQKDPLLTDAYQLACWTPSIVNPPAFLSPIRALVGSSVSRPRGGG